MYLFFLIVLNIHFRISPLCGLEDLKKRLLLLQWLHLGPMQPLVTATIKMIYGDHHSKIFQAPTVGMSSAELRTPIRQQH